METTRIFVFISILSILLSTFTESVPFVAEAYCPDCLDAKPNMKFTTCAHAYCEKCIGRILSYNRERRFCSICRRPCSESIDLTEEQKASIEQLRTEDEIREEMLNVRKHYPELGDLPENQAIVIYRIWKIISKGNYDEENINLDVLKRISEGYSTLPLEEMWKKTRCAALKLIFAGARRHTDEMIKILEEKKKKEQHWDALVKKVVTDARNAGLNELEFFLKDKKLLKKAKNFHEYSLQRLADSLKEIPDDPQVQTEREFWPVSFKIIFQHGDRMRTMYRKSKCVVPQFSESEKNEFIRVWVEIYESGKMHEWVKENNAIPREVKYLQTGEQTINRMSKFLSDSEKTM